MLFVLLIFGLMIDELVVDIVFGVVFIRKFVMLKLWIIILWNRLLDILMYEIGGGVGLNEVIDSSLVLLILLVFSVVLIVLKLGLKWWLKLIMIGLLVVVVFFRYF